MTKVGVLALQGAVEPHLRILRELKVPTLAVRSVEDLKEVDRLILPGGESTTMLKLLDRGGMFAPLQEFIQTRPTWGICAGSILMAQEVIRSSGSGEQQRSLGIFPVEAIRNFYGTQLDSFKTSLAVKGFQEPFAVDFIRAPRLRALSPEVEVLAEFQGNQVFLRYGHMLLSAFHVELGVDLRLHRYFVDLV